LETGACSGTRRRPARARWGQHALVSSVHPFL